MRFALKCLPRPRGGGVVARELARVPRHRAIVPALRKSCASCRRSCAARPRTGLERRFTAGSSRASAADEQPLRGTGAVAVDRCDGVATDPALESTRVGAPGHQLRVLRVVAGVEFKLKYAGSALGYVWSVVKPLALFTML